MGFELIVPRSNGRLIVFEGGHGSGKTTQAMALVKHLQDKGTAARYSKEPYGDDLIRIIEKYATEHLSGSPVLMYLLAASRYLHVQDIKSWLDAGEFVVCDRYILSSLVYQQIQGMTMKEITRVNYFAIKPEMTFFLDVSLKKRMERMSSMQRNRNSYFFKEGQLVKEQELYSSLVTCWNEKKYGRIVVIDGEGDVTKIKQILINSLFPDGGRIHKCKLNQSDLKR